MCGLRGLTFNSAIFFSFFFHSSLHSCPSIYTAMSSAAAARSCTLLATYPCQIAPTSSRVSRTDQNKDWLQLQSKKLNILLQRLIFSTKITLVSWLCRCRVSLWGFGLSWTGVNARECRGVGRVKQNQQLSKTAGMKRCCWRKRGYPILGCRYKPEERLEFFAPPPLILPQ